MNFSHKKSVKKDEVLDIFLLHESVREKRDDFAHDIILRLRKNNNLNYYKCEISKTGLGNIVLPWHDHDINLIQKGGQQLHEACKSFKAKSKTHFNSCCLTKARNLSQIVFKSLDINNSFSLLSNDKETVHPGQYSDYHSDALYIANGFHRLLAIGINYYYKNEFTPFDIYFVEK